MVSVSPSPQITNCYSQATLRALQKWPYSYGGGHPNFGPSAGKTGMGFDCSGWASDILHAGKILEHPSGPLGTHELEHWGLPGEGEFMTLWVINVPDVIEHCFLEFNMPGHGQQFSQAEKTGTICGWFPYMPTMGYTPRRRKP